MSAVPAFALLSALAGHAQVAGNVVDAVHAKGGTGSVIWLSVTEGGARKLLPLDPHTETLGAAVEVPSGAVFFDACPNGGDDRIVFADANGLVWLNGARAVTAQSLFVVPDRTALLAADLCGKDGAGRGELRLPVAAGLLVQAPGGPARTLNLDHGTKAYSGRVHRGFRPDRGYGAALSLYGPRLFDVDVDGDGDTDLVGLREGRLVAWTRNGALLAEAPVAAFDLGQKVHAPGADLRVRIVDVDGDKRADALVGVTRGALPERSEAWVVKSGAQPFSGASVLWKTDGLRAPLEVRRLSHALVSAQVDTSLVSLSAVVLTGRLPMRVSVGDGPVLDTQAKVDVRGARMEGAMPVANVDFDGDGKEDLVDLGEPGRANLHRGTANGFEVEAARTWALPRYEQVIALPALPGVVLIGSGKKTTPVAVLTWRERARPAR
jgi:hypothetical protein